MRNSTRASNVSLQPRLNHVLGCIKIVVGRRWRERILLLWCDLIWSTVPNANMELVEWVERRP